MILKKVCVAIDSFKGCLSSSEAGDAAREAIHRLLPDCEVLRFPIADGGEGLLETIVAAANGRYVTTRAHDPLSRLIDTRYVLSADGQTAYIEMAAISGLPLLRPEERNPWETTTYGTGELIREALDRGCRHFVVGIGGSATNDAGLGMLQALGFRFLDHERQELGRGGKILEKVAYVDDSHKHPALDGATFTVACDVNNPFYGPNGAAHVFAPQKGANPTMVNRLDLGLRSLAQVIRKETGRSVDTLEGAGAAGGMGGGLVAFLGARLRPGIDLLLDALQFRQKAEGADLIITGEGKADRQSLMGKVPSGLLREAQALHIPIVLIAGAVEEQAQLNQAGFKAVLSIQPGPTTLEEAMRPEVAKARIQNTVEQICRLLTD